MLKIEISEATQLFVLLQGWNSHSYLITTFLRPESSAVIFLRSTFLITCFCRTLRFVEFRVNESINYRKFSHNFMPSEQN